jgi:trk system potassium uptake protein
MSDFLDPHPFTTVNTLYPQAVRRLKWVEVFLQVMGVGGTIVQHGLHNLTKIVQWELGISVFLCMLAQCVILAYRYHWSLAKPSFFRRHRSLVIISLVWSVGTLGIIIFGNLIHWNGKPISRPYAILLLSEVSLVLRAIFSSMLFIRRSTARIGTNPALLLVGSFLILIATGTILLMLPKAYADPATWEEPFLDRLRIAVFTSTSASCVTGLIVVDTGGPTPYWSQTGQMIILGLFQLGGLGIMTCGAFFAVVSGRSMRMRESATLHEVLEADAMDKVRRLVIGIFGFTIVTELLGAVLLSGLWADLPTRQRVFYSLFHSVSAFCNAGFSLTPNSFVGMGTRWQIWAVMPALIIIGGLGFAVLYNVAMVFISYFRSLQKPPLFNLSRVRTHLSISSRVVLLTTAFLLVIGAVSYYLLESTTPPGAGTVSGDVDEVPQVSPAIGERIADAWFQSVTFRTAGFNTTDHESLKPATKLLAIFLMFIGAAPGSTGGGIKVMVFALAVLRLSSILQGRQRIEIGNRVISEEIVNRALTVLALGVLVTMTTTMLLVIFERNEAKFLDHMFEATSAFATVGVSSISTSTLKPPSQIVIIVTMFLGRVGPLTVLLGLAGQTRSPNYDYPVERVTLG